MPDRPAPELAAAVARAIAACGAPVPAETARRLVVLLELIAATPVGVTTVRDPLEAVERHVADALRGLVQVDAAPPGALADVGSGGGIPGLVLAAELCLPLAAPGGRVVLWIGASAEPTAIAAAAERVGGALVESADGLAVIAKHGPTPSGFPRRPGMAAKRPLA